MKTSTIFEDCVWNAATSTVISDLPVRKVPLLHYGSPIYTCNPVDVMTAGEVSNDQACRRHEQDRSGIVVRNHVAHETPWQPPWSRYDVVDATNVEL